jgi:hypothetical protein
LYVALQGMVSFASRPAAASFIHAVHCASVGSCPFWAVAPMASVLKCDGAEPASIVPPLLDPLEPPLLEPPDPPLLELLLLEPPLPPPSLPPSPPGSEGVDEQAASTPNARTTTIDLLCMTKFTCLEAERQDTPPRRRRELQTSSAGGQGSAPQVRPGELGRTAT